MHSLRVSSGAEALVARVLARDGSAGFGFTLSLEPAVARDMAAWDALARGRKLPLYLLLGGAYRRRLPLLRDEAPALAPDWDALREGILQNRYDLLRIDPWAWGSVEQVQTIAAVAPAFDLDIALVAPNAHPWEIAYCAALAATLPGADTRIVMAGDPPASEIAVPGAPGIGIDWSLEPAFAAIPW